jgi:DNA-binding winged helix-turn-helix (wHTH) protein
MTSISVIQHRDSPACIARRIRPVISSGAFRLNPWLIEPSLGRISSAGVERVVEPKTMEVLVHLASRAGEVTSSDELIDSVWRGRPMGDNPVHKCISQLRNALGDDARRPRYIGTIPKRGYRLLSQVERLACTPMQPAGVRPIRVCIDIWPPRYAGTASSSESLRDEREDVGCVVQRITPRLHLTLGREESQGRSHRDAAIDVDVESVKEIIRELALAMSAALR